ncbi:hypothetical protein J6590_026886, partial [Homalodisca vitripennis]
MQEGRIRGNHFLVSVEKREIAMVGVVTMMITNLMEGWVDTLLSLFEHEILKRIKKNFAISVSHSSKSGVQDKMH